MATSKYVDSIIIGSGMAGLYSAYNIKNLSPKTSFLILEKNNKSCIGGRANNDTFYGSKIVTGAGIGRKHKDKLLENLVKVFDVESSEFTVSKNYSMINNEYVDIMKIVNKLKKEYKNYKNKNHTFKQFATTILGEKLYNDFVFSTGYTDYENEDVIETLYYYGMEDNVCCWKAFSVHWKQLVLNLYNYIGEKHFKFSNQVKHVKKIIETNANANANRNNTEFCKAKYVIETEKGIQYFCNKVIIASTIDTIRKLIPNKPIYNDIEGQPFLRVYAKFTKKSIPILKQFVKSVTYLEGPLQKIIPMDTDNGIYMIAYNDNNNTLALKKYLENTKENRELYQFLLELSLKMPTNSLHIIGIKSYYWNIGTHYYKPLDKKLYSTRKEFIQKAQHPDKGILVVGEVVSRNQGWVEGALESVDEVVNKKWIETCFT